MSNELERTFEAEGKTYKLILPSSESVRLADWYYSKTYNEAMQKGISTHSEMMDILRTRGIVGPEHDLQLEKLQEQLGDKIVAMELETDRGKRLNLAVEVAGLRQDLFDWHHRVNSPLSHTCESLADSARTDYLTACMVQDDTGKLKWPTFDAFANADDRALAMQARMQVMLFMQGLAQDFLTRVPERQVLDDLAAQDAAAADAAAVAEIEAERSEELELVATADALEGPPEPPTRKRRRKKGPASSEEE